MSLGKKHMSRCYVTRPTDIITCSEQVRTATATECSVTVIQTVSSSDNQWLDTKLHQACLLSKSV